MNMLFNMWIMIFFLAVCYGFILESVGKYVGSFVGLSYQLHLPGIHFLGIPLLAVIGWGFCISIALSISTYIFRHQTFTLGMLVKMSMLDAFFLTLLDFVLEPSAVRLGWWEYFSDGKFYAVPVGNTLAWVGAVFVFSFLVRLGLKKMKKKLSVNKKVFVFSLASYFILGFIALGFAIYFGFYPIAFLAFIGWGILYVLYTKEI